MIGLFKTRKFVLSVLILAPVSLLAACDTSPASPTPVATPPTAQVVATATTQAVPSATTQAAAPTSTTQQSVSGNSTPATGGNKGKLALAPFGSIKAAPSPAPRGDLAARSLSVAQSSSPFDTLSPARATVTIDNSQPTATEPPPATSNGVPDNWSVVLDSDFSTGDPGTWLTGASGNVSANVQDGTYDLVVKDGSGLYTWADETSDWTDGYISATLKITGPGWAGVAGRVSKTGTKFTDIVCEIGNAGTYGCYKDVSGQSTTMGKGSSSAIKRNGINTVALLATGSDFTFFINGKAVKTFTAPEVTEGAWGAYAETDQGSTTTGAFSEILFMGPGDLNGAVTPTVEPTIEASATAVEVQPTDTIEAQPTDTAAATVRVVTRVPTASVVTRGTVTPTVNPANVIVSTDFSQDSGTWRTGQSAGFLIDVNNGELRVQAQNAHSIIATAPDESIDLADARIVGTVRIEDAGKTDHGFVGFSARSQEFSSNFADWSQIFCGINNTGAYTCDKLLSASDGTVNFTEVLHGKTSRISSSKPNTIALTGIGNRWTFEVNGFKMGSFTDNSVQHGAWGVLVTSGDAGITGYFSQVSVYKP